MTAASAPVITRPVRVRRRAGLATVRLLRLELRHNAMFWLLPMPIAVFWFTSYRKTLAMPPLWFLSATRLQSGVVTSFIVPVVGAAAWTGSREARRRMTDLMTITARSRWARLLVTWAATTTWALLGYGVCVALAYGVTAREATWGGPLWWPAAVAAASLVAYSAVGFVAGALLPGRLTAPLVAIGSFFVLVLSTELITGSQSYWQISPVVAGPWDFGPSLGMAAFYPFLPDLSIAQVTFLAGLTGAALGALALRGNSRSGRAVAAAVVAAGLLAAGTGVGLAGTGRLNDHGMISIPALHDAASDRPLPWTAVCTSTAIPICLNPAYAGDMPGVAAALSPVLTEIAGLPGAPARVSQGAPAYQQGPGNEVNVSMSGLQISGRVYRMLLPDEVPGLQLTASQLAGQVRATIGPAIIASFTGDGPGSSEAQQAVAAALSLAARLPVSSSIAHSPRSACSSRTSANCRPAEPGVLAVSNSEYRAAQRLDALPLAARRAWLARHLTALRAGQITLAQLP